MISKIKENNTLYIRKCKHCKSIFSYDVQDYVSSYGYSNSYGNVKCPYCSSRNKIKFKIRYKSSKKVNQEYKVELEKVKNKNEKLNSIIEKLENEKSKLKDKANKYDTMESSYKLEKKSKEVLRDKCDELNGKIYDINEYINDYMNSSKKNNLATKYLKEIQEIIK